MCILVSVNLNLIVLDPWRLSVSCFMTYVRSDNETLPTNDVCLLRMANVDGGGE